MHYWAINGEFGPDFRREDVVFECFHNFLAFSQWGNTLYSIMGRITEEGGDAAMRAALREAMEGDPDAADDNGFTALDRLVMEYLPSSTGSRRRWRTWQAMRRSVSATVAVLASG